MLNLNNKSKSLLTLFIVILSSFISFYTIIYITKKVTEKNEVIYNYWETFKIKEISLIDNRVNLTIVDTKTKEYTLISEPNCSFKIGEAAFIINRKMMLEVSIVESRTIFNSIRKERIRSLNEASNYLCNSNYKERLR